MKFSFNQPLKEILYLQEYGSNKDKYSFLNVNGHIGIDYTIGDGDPVYAKYSGVVVYVRHDSGDVVQLTDFKDPSGFDLEISYSHMKDIIVKQGDRVERGDIIGYQNSHGWSVVWKSEFDRIAWSHVHVNFRPVLRVDNPVPQNLIWNFVQFSHIPYKVIESDAKMDHFIDPTLYSEQIIEKFIKGIATFEGFTNGASRIAVKNNNPGNLRYSHLQDGERGGFAYFSSVDKGWEALRYDVALKAKGKSRWLAPTATILDFCNVYAPASDGNHPINYAKFLINFCGLRGVNDPLSDILLTEMEWLKKYNFNSAYAFPDNNGKIGIIAKAIKFLWSIAYKNK